MADAERPQVSPWLAGSPQTAPRTGSALAETRRASPARRESGSRAQSDQVQDVTARALDAGDPGELPAHRCIPAWSRPPGPHLGGVPDDAQDIAAAGWWWLGVHGGAGVSTLAEFLPGGVDAHRLWPSPAVHRGPGAVILVCRTHLSGLARARDAIQQWREAKVPDGVLLAGLVAVADAAEKLTNAQAEALRLVAGIAPRMWTVPWLTDLRSIAPAALPLAPALVKVSLDLEALRHSYGTIW
jgi:hypothetical protein